MTRWLRRLAAGPGFSTLESSAIVLGMSIVAATAGPQLQEYLELARHTKAEGDVRVVAVSLTRLLFDVGSIRTTRGGTAVRPELVASDGEAPLGTEAPVRPWTGPVDPTNRLAAHLVDNQAGYPTGARSTGANWRGPYIDGLTPDPWGHRYAVNAGILQRSGVLIVLSAGPNGIVETAFELEVLTRGGDDIVASAWRTR